MASGLLLAASLAALSPADVQASVGNRIVATVDGEPITTFQMDAFIRANVRGANPEQISAEDRKKVLDLRSTT